MPPLPTDQSSAKPPPTLTTADEFCLSGPSRLPDPHLNAYRNDLADVALAATVIASHYAEPLDRVVVTEAVLRTAPAESAAIVRELTAGEPFALLDDSLGWSWGYARSDRRVGYVPSGALAAG